MCKPPTFMTSWAVMPPMTAAMGARSPRAPIANSVSRSLSTSSTLQPEPTFTSLNTDRNSAASSCKHNTSCGCAGIYTVFNNNDHFIAVNLAYTFLRRFSKPKGNQYLVHVLMQVTEKFLKIQCAIFKSLNLYQDPVIKIMVYKKI